MKRDQLAQRDESRAELAISASQESQMLSKTRAAALEAAEPHQRAENLKCTETLAAGNTTRRPLSANRAERQAHGPAVLLHRTPQPTIAVRTLL